MPTLFRLIFVLSIAVAAGYGALYGMANLIEPHPRLIVEAIALPQSTDEIQAGRSVAEMLNHQASALVQHRRHHP